MMCLLSSHEAADMLGVSEITLRGWRSCGTGPPFIRLARRCVRYDPADLEQYIQAHRIVEGKITSR